MNLKLLYGDRSEEDKEFILEVGNFIFGEKIKNKEKSNNFAGVFIDGRDRDFTFEDLMCFYSFKRFSKFNYPICLFLVNPEKFIKQINNLNLNIDFNFITYKIDPILSLEDYTRFHIHKLYEILSVNFENILTIQPDGMIIKSGFEDYILKNNFDWISSHWRHLPNVHIFNQRLDCWVDIGYNRFPIGNGGFSYRKVSKMKEIAIKTKNLILREAGREDNRIPMEDLHLTYFGFNSGNWKIPSLAECCKFARDPLTKDLFNNFLLEKDFFYGFHFFSSKTHWPKCFH